MWSISCRFPARAVPQTIGEFEPPLGIGHVAFQLASARDLRCAYFELIDAQIRVLAAIDHVGLIADRIAAFCSLAGRAREEERHSIRD
ncbi:MAG: hypothetical protein WCA81_03910 [Rhizomicrobium sp.]